jgi:hypothetical protein
MLFRAGVDISREMVRRWLAGPCPVFAVETPKRQVQRRSRHVNFQTRAFEYPWPGVGRPTYPNGRWIWGNS